jgi:acetyltransferase-like isoleucine patch superfamily enzyme
VRARSWGANKMPFFQLEKFCAALSKWIRSWGPEAKFERSLNSTLVRRRREVDALWQRSVPFGDYFSDRFQRASELGFGAGSSIYDSCLVIGAVSVGKSTWIGPFVVLDGSGNLTIGDNCSISAGAQIYTHDTVDPSSRVGASLVPRDSVTLGNDVYIGPNVVIARGVFIGSGAVVGANSFVNKDIPPGAHAWGNPATVQDVMP